MWVMVTSLYLHLSNAEPVMTLGSYVAVCCELCSLWQCWLQLYCFVTVSLHVWVAMSVSNQWSDTVVMLIATLPFFHNCIIAFWGSEVCINQWSGRCSIHLLFTNFAHYYSKDCTSIVLQLYLLWMGNEICIDAYMFCVCTIINSAKALPLNWLESG